MKKKNLPIIISACLAAAFAIAAVLCFVIPLFTASKDNSPVQVESEIKISYTSFENHPAYYLIGSIKNVSDKEVKIPIDGGIKVYFRGSDDIADDWFETKNESGYITLAPNEEFDLIKDTDYYFYFSSSGVSVSKVTVNADGKTYTLVGTPGGGTPSILGLAFAVIAIGGIALSVNLARKNKNQATITAAPQTLPPVPEPSDEVAVAEEDPFEEFCPAEEKQSEIDKK